MKKTALLTAILAVIVGQTPDELLQQGQTLLAQGDLTGAKDVLGQAIMMDSTYAPAMITLSNVYLRMGDMDKTQEFIRKAIGTDPENEEYRDEFDRLNEINTLMVDGQRNLNNGNYAKALESYQIVLEKFPFFAEAAYRMGSVKYRERDISAAINYFKDALAINPQHEDARTAIANAAKYKFTEGDTNYRQKNLEGALKAYQDVLEIDESFYQAHYWIGKIQSKMGDKNLAIEHYRKALDIKPTFYKGYYAMASSQRSIGDDEGALTSLQSAVEINPEYDKAYGVMGDIYIEREDYNQAISILNTAKEVNPQYAKGFYSLGIIYSELKNYEAAIQNLKQATELDDSKHLSWYLLAEVYNITGDCENAKNAARKCTDLKSSFGGGWLELGVAEWCGGKGNKQAAENALEKARNDQEWRESAEYEIDSIRNPEKYQK